MKVTSLKKGIAFGLAAMFSVQVYAQKITNAGDYLSFIGKEFKQISNEMWDYTSAAAHGKSARTVENKRKEIVNQLTRSISKIERLPDFQGDASYRDSVVSYLKLNKLVMNEDYAKIVDMEEIAEQSYDAMEAYMLAKEKADDKMEAASDMLDIQEKKFAASNGITLVENEDKVSKKLKEASEVYKYYNVIYLIFFKSYKQELYVLDAQNKGDFNAMEQNKNALTKTAAEGKAKLTQVKPYKGDGTVKAACQDMLNFYEKEASKFTDISNFFLQKEKFDKIKTSFDAKKPAQRTKTDVDQFNAAVNEFNAASNKYNATNQELNQNRSKLLEKWNNSSERMIDRFVPKKKK